MESRQVTCNLLMVRPANFHLNEETAVNNFFQTEIDGLSDNRAQSLATKEFDDFVIILRKHDINVQIVQDTNDPETPDSIFPNNWISFHHDGTIVLYPMFAENRRDERRSDIRAILEEEGYEVTMIKDYTQFEHQGKFLEGTGSMILDRDNRVVYAALSDRTNEEVLNRFCEDFSYDPVIFHAYQTYEGERLPIYHTNVMMGLTRNFAVVCLDSIDDLDERDNLIESLEEYDKEIIELTEHQVEQFAGNMLGVINNKGKEFTVMSESARNCLTHEQIQKIEKYSTIISSPIGTIETLGGGSTRCMMAEVFLPKK